MNFFNFCNLFHKLVIPKEYFVFGIAFKASFNCFSFDNCWFSCINQITFLHIKQQDSSDQFKFSISHNTHTYTHTHTQTHTIWHTFNIVAMRKAIAIKFICLMKLIYLYRVFNMPSQLLLFLLICNMYVCVHYMYVCMWFLSAAALYNCVTLALVSQWPYYCLYA